MPAPLLLTHPHEAKSIPPAKLPQLPRAQAAGATASLAWRFRHRSVKSWWQRCPTGLRPRELLRPQMRTTRGVGTAP